MTLIISYANYKYFVTFIYYYSRFTWIYFIRSKEEVVFVFTFFQAYIQNQFSVNIKTLHPYNRGEFVFTFFQAHIQNQFSTNIKTLHPYNRGEYMPHLFQEFLQTNCIISQLFCPPPPSKMKWLKERTITFLMLFAPSYQNHMCPLGSGMKLSPLLSIS